MKAGIEKLNKAVIIESFRFEEENDHEYGTWLSIFSRILKKQTPRKVWLYFSSARKVITFIFIEGGQAISWSQNDKTPNNW